MQPAPRFITLDGVHLGLTMVGTLTSEHVITGLFQFSVGSEQTFSHPITPAHCFGAVPYVRCSHSVRVCSHLYWEKVFISGFCVI